MAWLCQQFGLERDAQYEDVAADGRAIPLDLMARKTRAGTSPQTMCEILQKYKPTKIALEFDMELSSRGAAGLYFHNERERNATK